MRGKKVNWIISGYHANNGNNAEKWQKVNAVLNELDDAYKWPKLVCMDINTDVEHKKFVEWENTLARRGWEVLKNNDWTRKGKNKQKDTNIDVILIKGIPLGSIQAQAGEYDDLISDHKPITIQIRDQDFHPEQISQRDLIIDKGVLKQSSRFLLQDIIDASNLKEIL